MKNLILITLFTIGTYCAYSQKTTTWRGGTPGHEKEWNCNKNWSSGKVPDTFSDVVIPDCSSIGNFYPVIKFPIEYNTIRFDVPLEKVFKNFNTEVYHLVQASTKKER
jgi:hypothetical protein